MGHADQVYRAVGRVWRPKQKEPPLHSNSSGLASGSNCSSNPSDVHTTGASFVSSTMPSDVHADGSSAGPSVPNATLAGSSSDGHADGNFDGPSIPKFQSDGSSKPSDILMEILMVPLSLICKMMAFQSHVMFILMVILMVTMSLMFKLMALQSQMIFKMMVSLMVFKLMALPLGTTLFILYMGIAVGVVGSPGYALLCSKKIFY